MRKLSNIEYNVYKSEFVSGLSDIHKDKMVRKSVLYKEQFIKS